MEPSTSTTTDASALTLRAWPHAEKGAQHSLSTLIGRINAQEGSFRNITEASLEETIRQAGSDVQPEEITADDDGEEEEKSQREKVHEAKAEIIKLATQAWTESSHTLDLISLVVSQFNPKGAEYTMTPFIKQTLPSGCFGAEGMEVPQEKESVKQANDLTSFGWKLESLTTSADSLLRAASSLETEMAKEAKYWKDILAVKNKDWSMCTMPRERHTMGVRYGFLESGPEFRDRGLAALRRGEDGRVNLDLGATYLTPRPLHVQVKKKGAVIASTSEVLRNPESLEASILQARNNIFDEELYHEMNREARALTNRGVKCVGDGIVIALEDDVQLIVSLFDEDASSLTQAASVSSKDYENIPEFAATAFRLLLSHSHRQHYLRRTELPPPIKKRKTQRPLPTIIKPILSHLEHRSYLERMTRHLQTLNAVLAQAEEPLVLSPVESNLNVSRLLDPKDLDEGDFANALVELLCSTLHSSIRMQLGSDGPMLTIAVRTHASGTEFRTNKSNTRSASTLNQTSDTMHFSDISSLSAYLAHLLILHLVDQAAATLDDGRWLVTDPDAGELTTEPTVEGVVETLQVELGHGELDLIWRSSNGDEAEVVRWTEGDNKKSFLDEVRRLGALRGSVVQML